MGGKGVLFVVYASDSETLVDPVTRTWIFVSLPYIWGNPKGTFYGSFGDILRAVRGHFAGDGDILRVARFTLSAQFVKGTFCGSLEDIK
jgi:hypothetical protein